MTNLWDLMHEEWRFFKEHRPQGEYMPVGQLDGDCKKCHTTWPCPTYKQFIGQLTNKLMIQKEREDADGGWPEFGETIICSYSGCPSEVKNNRWAKIKSEWFFQMNGEAWCTEHIPDWVEDWRAKRSGA